MYDTKNILWLYGKDIIISEGMQSEKNYVHHGMVSCFDHSIRVTELSIRIALRFHIPIHMSSLVRGALLHDYFLYDWHIADPSHRFHGFIHARKALKNAERDFSLNSIERNIITTHMFPLNLRIPKCKESFLVCFADKLCAIYETASILLSPVPVN